MQLHVMLCRATNEKFLYIGKVKGYIRGWWIDSQAVHIQVGGVKHGGNIFFWKNIKITPTMSHLKMKDRLAREGILGIRMKQK